MSFNFDRDITDPSHSSIMTRKRRFFQYLPLDRNGEYITGLTIYQNGLGIAGLEAHFTHMSQLSGCRSGCSLYFPLGPKEQIAYSWLRVVNFNPAFYGLALAVSPKYIRYWLPLTCRPDSNNIRKISHLWVVHSARPGHGQPI
jgi:hypothetical protein